MSLQIQIYPTPPRIEKGNIVASANIQLPTSDVKSLFYSVPLDYRSCMTESSDPFVLALLFQCMWQRADLHVHGHVSSSLLANLSEFQAFWSTVYSKSFAPIEIHADSEGDSPRANDKTILSYSGGMDSNFSAWRHHTGSAGRKTRHLDAALMVHGFDIPLAEPEMYARSFANSRRMLDSIGLELIPMVTNCHSFVPLWLLTHGALLASALMMLRAGYGVGMIPSSHTYRALLPILGSNPISDPMLSSNGFEIIHDGARFTRPEKARELSTWTEAMRYLRVCWVGLERDRNCCRCSKCIRTMLNFRAANLPRPACFEHDVSLWQIATRGPIGRISIPFFQEILDDAHTNNVHGSWVTLLQVIVPLYAFLVNFVPPQEDQTPPWRDSK